MVETAPASTIPLSERLRPSRLEDVVGQDALLGPSGPIGRMLSAGAVRSMVLWGPPGVGKTTIARLLADRVGAAFTPMSAVMAGVADLRRVVEAAQARQAQGARTLLFVDEIHRWNRAQQDGLLPHLESGAVILVGATTENPSFALVGALLSRAPVAVLRPLDAGALSTLSLRAEAALAGAPFLAEDARDFVASCAEGDGRALVGFVEAAFEAAPRGADGSVTAPVGVAAIEAALLRRAPAHDRAGDGHFGLLSAFHKSVRGSDADAALYYAARMIEAGEDPRVLLRRLACCASEDVGMADPQAMVQAMTAWEAFERLGWPEGRIPLAQAIVYVATAPKSNAACKAFDAAFDLARSTGAMAPPDAIRNAPTAWMKAQGVGDGYEYDHDCPDGYSGQTYLPDALRDDPRAVFYRPVERGFERDMRKRLAFWSQRRAARTPR